MEAFLTLIASWLIVYLATRKKDSIRPMDNMKRNGSGVRTKGLLRKKRRATES